jgi:hypothetical protein
LCADSRTICLYFNPPQENRQLTVFSAPRLCYLCNRSQLFTFSHQGGRNHENPQENPRLRVRGSPPRQIPRTDPGRLRGRGWLPHLTQETLRGREGSWCNGSRTEGGDSLRHHRPLRKSQELRPQHGRGTRALNHKFYQGLIRVNPLNPRLRAGALRRAGASSAFHCFVVDLNFFSEG